MMTKNITQEKERLRKEITSIKKKCTSEELYNRSEEVLSVLEITGAFQEAKTIFIYNSLNDEVQTSDFIRKWSNKKDFYLPVVAGEDIVFRLYTPSTDFQQSSLGIMEPVGDDYTEYGKVDLVIVPGVAFDRKLNRMGRGKGFYDRFLPRVPATKIGICFDFQLFDSIPTEPNDIKMDFVVSENDLIWK
ncbi:MAG: 5-formyltetrahydrofolate cyclo-ligase [Prevotella sp.]|jgi:5-formyltetrahydrofolate cyclo-ligase|nr:5-formyltetrahydrofolate cyclo-ligase [Prevotella sp.]